MSETGENTENISAPRDKSLDMHWEPRTLGHRSPDRSPDRSQSWNPLEKDFFLKFGKEGSGTVGKQKQTTQPFTATNQRA